MVAVYPTDGTGESPDDVGHRRNFFIFKHTPRLFKQHNGLHFNHRTLIPKIPLKYISGKCLIIPSKRPNQSFLKPRSTQSVSFEIRSQIQKGNPGCVLLCYTESSSYFTKHHQDEMVMMIIVVIAMS